MANRLEAVCWDSGLNDVVEPLHGLSYVKVTRRDGSFLTSSMLEAHRLNSPYIERATPAVHAKVKDEILGTMSGPVDRVRFLKTTLKYDIGSLLHGVFLESMDGRLRVARAMSAFIEADNVRVAASGGVKNDRIQPGKDEAGSRTAKEGFGNVPFARDEFTAGRITFYANVDLGQIRGYGLGAEVERLLVLLALYKLRMLLDGSLRLRTACDLEVDSKTAGSSIRARRPEGFELPAAGNLELDLKESIAVCHDRMTMSEVRFEELGKAKDEAKASSDEVDDDAGED
jgi:CRISPR-associated protein Csb1